MSDLFNTGSSGLLAFQRAIATTSHNIANSETEGYTRQRIDLQARAPVNHGGGEIGRGVDAYRTERVADRFANARVVELASEHASQTANRDMARQLDALIAGEALDVTPAMSEFFAAIEDANADPSSVASREVLLGRTQHLAERFRALDGQFANVATETNDRLRASVAEINDLSAAIADVNQRIANGGGQSGTERPNDLLDQREQLLSRLAEHIDVRSLETDGGGLTVTIGSGVPLVLGTDTVELRAVPSDDAPERLSIEAGQNGGWIGIDAQLAGGAIGGLRRFERESLQPARAELGRTARVLVDQVNAQHREGADLDGNTDIDLFTPLTPEVVTGENNTGGASITVSVADATALRASDYIVVHDGTDVQVRRERDGNTVTLTASPQTIDGLSFSLTGAPNAGDRFRVSAVGSAASAIDVALADPRAVALSTQGSASDPTYNAVGDNGNGRALAALQTDAAIEGTSTFSESYGTLVSFVGGRTRTAEIASDSAEALLDDARERKLSISGVNLDEEAIALTRYEQAYRASAQIISTADELFDVLLGAVAR